MWMLLAKHIIECSVLTQLPMLTVAVAGNFWVGNIAKGRNHFPQNRNFPAAFEHAPEVEWNKYAMCKLHMDRLKIA
ncbi:hypothetical protein CsSME_00017476 [Camellia sinensis var. sinensis]